MKTARFASASVAAIVLLAGSYAQAEAAAQQDTVLAVEWLEIENEAARGHMQQGDEALAAGRYATARRHYEQAAELIREAGDFPAMAVHREAASFYHEGMYSNAISTLSRLSREAAEYGDVVTQVWALADEAWVEGKAGKKIDMERTLEALHKVLKSPYLPDAVRNEVTSKRLGEATTLIVPEN